MGRWGWGGEWARSGSGGGGRKAKQTALAGIRLAQGWLGWCCTRAGTGKQAGRLLTGANGEVVGGDDGFGGGLRAQRHCQLERPLVQPLQLQLRRVAPAVRQHHARRCRSGSGGVRRDWAEWVRWVRCIPLPSCRAPPAHPPPSRDRSQLWPHYATTPPTHPTLTCRKAPGQCWQRWGAPPPRTCTRGRSPSPRPSTAASNRTW